MLIFIKYLWTNPQLTIWFSAQIGATVFIISPTTANLIGTYMGIICWWFSIICCDLIIVTFSWCFNPVCVQSDTPHAFEYIPNCRKTFNFCLITSTIWIMEWIYEFIPKCRMLVASMLWRITGSPVLAWAIMARSNWIHHKYEILQKWRKLNNRKLNKRSHSASE